MLEVISNVTTKTDILGKYVLPNICQYKVREWIIKIGFKYYYAIGGYYIDGH